MSNYSTSSSLWRDFFGGFRRRSLKVSQKFKANPPSPTKLLEPQGETLENRIRRFAQGATPHSEKKTVSKSRKWINLGKGATLRLEIILSEFDDGCVVKHSTTSSDTRVKLVLVGLFSPM